MFKMFQIYVLNYKMYDMVKILNGSTEQGCEKLKPGGANVKT